MTWTEGVTTLFNGGIIIGGGWLGVMLAIILFGIFVLMWVYWGKVLFYLLKVMEKLANNRRSQQP